MDAATITEEEEARAGDRVVGEPGEFEDAEVVGRGLELGQHLDVVGWDAMIVILGLGFVWA